MRATILIVMCLVLCVARPVSAENDEYRGDGYSQAPVVDKTRWIGFVYAGVALAGIAVVGFKDARRTHLD